METAGAAWILTAASLRRQSYQLLKCLENVVLP